MTTTDWHAAARLVVWLIAITTLSNTAFSQDAAEPDVAALIKQLGSDERPVRSQAEQTLLRGGDRVLSRLPPDATITDLAVRDALRRIRNRLEEQQALATLEPTRVDLHGARTLRAILDKLTLQTHNSINGDGISDQLLGQKLSVNFDNLIFWESLDRVLSDAGLDYAASPASDAITLVPHAPDAVRKRVQYSGVFRMAGSIGAAKGHPSDAASEIIPLELSIMIEPRLHALSLDYTDGDFSLTTADGAVLKPFTPDARFALPLGNGRRTLLFVQPRTIVATSYRLKGRFSVLIVADPQPVVFSDLQNAAKTSLRRGQVTVSIQDTQFDGLAANAGTMSLRIAVAYTRGGPAFESYRTWPFRNHAFLRTLDGETIECCWKQTARQADGALAIDYRFKNLSDSADAYQFVYETPILITSVSVPVDLSGM